MQGGGYYSSWTSGAYDPPAITAGGTTNTSDSWTAMTIALKPYVPNDPPTVALNSPSDTESITDLTPTMAFTGTDSESNEIEYNIQLDTVNTFDSQGTTLIDSYPSANASGATQMYVGQYTRIGQSFTGSDGVVASIVMYGFKTGSPTGNAVVKIYRHGGIFGSTGIPVESAIATSDNVDVTTWTTGADLRTFTFSGTNKIHLRSGEKYCLAVEYSGGNASNYIAIDSDGTSPTHIGNAFYWNDVNGYWSVNVTYDTCFYVYTDVPLLSKVSDPYTVADSYPSSNAEGSLPMCVGSPYYTQIGQTFKSQTGGTLSLVKFQMGITGSPTGSVVSKLYAHTGTFGTTGVPTGSALATSATVSVSSFSEGDIVSFDFSSSSYTLVAGTAYAIVAEYTEAGSSTTNCIANYVDDSPTHDGSTVIWNNNLSSWGAVNAYDTIFYVYVTNTDYGVGFSSGHPFASGAQATYDIQDALSIDTYYWRVAGIDPDGSNSYGSWSSTYSFTTLDSPFAISGTSDQTSGTVSVAVNSTLQAQTGTIDGDGTWTISGVTKPSSGDSITVFISDAAAADVSTAFTTYGGSGEITGMVLNRHVLSIGSGQNRSITLADMADYDYDQNNRILFSANGSPATLLMDPGSLYSDEKINILSGDTLTIGATETLTAHDVEINGTLASGGASTYGISGDWVNNGTFTASSSTVTLNGTATQALSGTLNSSSSFYNLTITNNSGASPSDNERTGFTPSVDFNSAVKVTNDYTITTANVRVEYESGATYEFNNINWNGQATGSRIYFRNSAVTGTWLLKVTGTQTAVSYVNVSRSDASVSGGSTIDALDGTNHNSANNTNWVFFSNRIRQELPITSGRVGDYSSLSTQNASVGIVHLNESSYAEGGTFYFEIVAKNVNVTNDYIIYFRNWSGDAIIGSITVPKSTSTFTIFRSAAFTPVSGGCDLYMNLPQTAANSDIVVRVSRVVVIVTANPIIRNETQIDIGAHEAAKNNTTTAPLTNPKYWNYDSAVWDGGCVFSAEISASNTGSSITCILQEDDGAFGSWTTKATIANAQSSTLYKTYRVAFLPTSGRNYRISANIASSSSSYTISRASIIVEQFPGYPGYSYTGTNTKLANPSTLPPGNATLTAWDPTNTYLAVSSDTSNYLRIYKRSGDTFTALTPGSYPSSAAYSVEFDPTGTYLAVGLGSTPYYVIYKRNGDTFTALTTPLDTTPAGVGSAVRFSPNGTYITLSCAASPYIYIYKKNAGLDTWNKLANPTLPTNISNFHCWSDDSSILAVAQTTTPFINIYTNNGDDTFTKLSNPGTLPAGFVRGCSFSHDPAITFLAVAHDTSPFLTVYVRSGTTYTKMTNPTTLPVTGGRGVNFMNLNQSKQGQLMVITGQGSPYIWAYLVSTTHIMKSIPNPLTLPAGITSSAAFTSDNQYMAVPNAVTSPFLTIYKRANAQYFTKFEAQYELLNFSSSTTGDQSVMTTYDPAEWMGVTQTFYAEQNGSLSSSNSKIRNSTDGTDVANSNITGANRVRGATPLTMPDQKKDLDANIVAA